MRSNRSRGRSPHKRERSRQTHESRGAAPGTWVAQAKGVSPPQTVVRVLGLVASVSIFACGSDHAGHGNGATSADGGSVPSVDGGGGGGGGGGPTGDDAGGTFQPVDSDGGRCGRAAAARQQPRRLQLRLRLEVHSPGRHRRPGHGLRRFEVDRRQPPAHVQRRRYVRGLGRLRHRHTGRPAPMAGSRGTGSISRPTRAGRTGRSSSSSKGSATRAPST